MLLAIDIGNTNIAIGLFDKEDLVFKSKMATNKNKLSDEYAVKFKSILNLFNAGVENIDGAIISSVVPRLTNIMSEAILKCFKVNPIVVGPGVKNGINIRVENPSQMGSDIVCCAVGALAAYIAPIIIIDLGTATTISVVDKTLSLIGTAIIPGARISLDALSLNASQLQEVNIEQVKDILGTNTVDSMKAGILFGSASMIDGMIERIEDKIGQNPTIVATGGLSGIVIPNCKKMIIQNPDLLLKGLQIIYSKNL